MQQLTATVDLTVRSQVERKRNADASQLICFNLLNNLVSVVVVANVVVSYGVQLRLNTEQQQK